MKRIYTICMLLLLALMPAVQSRAVDAQAAKVQDVTERADLELVRQWIDDDMDDALEDETILREHHERFKQQWADYQQRCDRYRVRMYSCKEGRLFETSFYLEQVMKLYDELDEYAVPDSNLMDELDRNVLRYRELLHTLQTMPLQPQEVHEAREVLPRKIKNYIALELNIKTCLQQEARQYAALRDRFRPTRDYALGRYQYIRESIIDGGQLTLADILTHPATFWRSTWDDCYDKYAHLDKAFTVWELCVVLLQMFGMLALGILVVWLLKHIPWTKRKFSRLLENPNILSNLVYAILLMICLMLDTTVWHFPLIMINGVIFFVYFSYLITLQVSLLIREHGEKATAAMHLYVPSIAFGYVLTFTRFFFVPDSLMILYFIPCAIGCLVWESIMIGRYWNRVATIDALLAMVSSIVFLVMTFASLFGFAFFSIELFFWWQAQQASLAVIIALLRLTKHRKTKIDQQKIKYMEKSGKRYSAEAPKYLIQVTWLSDMIRMVVIPLLGILTVPLCITAAMDFFHGGQMFTIFLHRTLYSLGTSDNLMFEFSLYNLMLVASLFFVFRYVRHVAMAIYVQSKIHAKFRQNGNQEVEQNQVNVALGTRMISILVWGMYVVAICVVLHLPLQSITVILAGMAAGLSFAMQEILNNFFYGMQLMAGYLRVGDYVICDDFRGNVTDINYQTTRLRTESGAEVCFTNHDLFSKNFQNLTKDNPYEINRVELELADNNDLPRLETVVREVVMSLNKPDKYGRNLFQQGETRLEMEELSPGYQLALRFGILAEQRTKYVPILRRALYERLQKEGIRLSKDDYSFELIKND